MENKRQRFRIPTEATFMKNLMDQAPFFMDRSSVERILGKINVTRLDCRESPVDLVQERKRYLDDPRKLQAFDAYQVTAPPFPILEKGIDLTDGDRGMDESGRFPVPPGYYYGRIRTKWVYIRDCPRCHNKGHYPDYLDGERLNVTCDNCQSDYYQEPRYIV